MAIGAHKSNGVALVEKFQMQEREREEKKSIFADLNSHYGNSMVAGDTTVSYMHIKCNVG